jgi:D-cysteine desulfhydrase
VPPEPATRRTSRQAREVEAASIAPLAGSPLPMRLAELPRFRLGTFPSPLQPAARLSEALGVPVLIKRDDLTGVGLGGNKVRKLEYLIADARDRDADVILTGGGPQSNHAALTALAAGRAGIRTHLVCYGHPRQGPAQGNAILYALAGAQVTYTGDADRSSVDGALESLAQELRAKGHRPYVIPRGGATPLGCVGYVLASLELAAQLAELGLSPTHLILATGSCGTQAGLEVGAAWLQASYRVVGVTVSRPRAECLQRISSLGRACAELLGLDVAGSLAHVEVVDGYLGPGYGKSSPEGSAAMELVASTEGLLLDPVFTAKAMAALRDMAGTIEPGPVVFLHTGGAPAAFVAASAMEV